MKLSIELFEIEIISKSEFVDDYSAENKNFLVTIWNIHVSGEALWRWLTSEMPDSDTFFNSREEYIAEVQRCENERREFKGKIEKFLGRENISISQAHAEFFTAIKIEEIDNKYNTCCPIGNTGTMWQHRRQLPPTFAFILTRFAVSESPHNGMRLSCPAKI